MSESYSDGKSVIVTRGGRSLGRNHAHASIDQIIDPEGMRTHTLDTLE